ncbi:hypothetical protein H312_02086 [Anncaliia algerae PRA339]|uniref:60S acidic ribosomal protein P1 n=1 Tax=Anncaliia algerae PRA339 TaxID=1288291 RepID=A0A059F0H5_9MICR|nr:hypothetical protein H312_02086 [Anncaliia algerae PRA339]
MSVPQDKQTYSLAALFINSLNLEVTQENMEVVFKHLNLPFSRKLASLFELTPAEYNSIIQSGSSVQVAVAPSAVSETKTEEKKEATKPAAAEEDDDIDFGDMFG